MLSIEQHDIEFLEANRGHYNTWVKAQYVQHLDGNTRSRMLDIIRRYFAGNYIADLWCQSCVAEMLVYLYVQYDKYLADAPAKEEQPAITNLLIKNGIGLIGDFIGTLPVLHKLAETHQLTVIVPEEIAGLAVLGAKDNIEFVTSAEGVPALVFDLTGAFEYAGPRDLHMIQAHYHFMCLPVPKDVPRPQLNIAAKNVKQYDYVLAPFSRSLPVEQLWQPEKWQALVNSMPDKTFALFGNSKHDNPKYIKGKNVTAVFDKDFTTVANIMQKAKHGVISVVTGISHLAYALNVTNYLFCNQGNWGRNPDAVLMNKYIPDITVEEVIYTLTN